MKCQNNLCEFVAEHCVLHKERDKLNKNYFIRKNPRLKDYDYILGGYYFITICTENKIQYFGKIVEGKIELNDVGKLAYSNIEKLEEIYNTIKIDKFVVMPNHIHLILIIDKTTDLTISRIVKQYKEWITKIIRKKIWKKSYYDHIIRNETDYLRICKYIDENII